MDTTRSRKWIRGIPTWARATDLGLEVGWDDASKAEVVCQQLSDMTAIPVCGETWEPMFDQKLASAGWASLEHPDFVDGEVPASGVRLPAFVIQKSTGTGCMALGNWVSPKIPVYRVLFLRPEQVPGYEAYERVGVGRVYGYEFQEEYQQAEEEMVYGVIPDRPGRVLPLV